MNRLILYLSLFLQLCVCIPARATLNLLFTAGNELPNSLINCVAEDAEEMLWVATEDGLCRFNGSQFVNYSFDPSDPHSIQSNFVRTVCCSPDGYVLVATISGVQLYQPATDDFSPVIFDEALGIPAGNVSGLTALANGDFLVSGNTTFTIHIDDHGQPQAIANPFTQQVYMSLRSCQDAQGRVWSIRSNDGIFYLDEQGQCVEVTDGVHSYGFTSLGVGPDGCVYAGGLERGLFKYNNVSNRFDEVTTLAHNFKVKDLCPIQGTDRMYVATDGDGVKVFDCKTGQFSQYIFDDAQVEAETQKVHSLLQARNGDLWMALYQKGVFVVSQNSIDFHYIGPRSLRYNSIGDRCVTSLMRSHTGNLWVGTDNGGLYCVDHNGTRVSYLPCSSQPGGVPQSVVTLFEDSQHRCWAGSYGQGGGIVDLNTGKCQNIPIEGLRDVTTNIYGYAEDRRGTIWVASMGHGILRYNEQSRQFQQLSLISPCDWSGCICYQPSADRLYVGTYSGLVIIQLGGSELTCQNYLPELVIYSISSISPTQMALCTNSGLVIFDCDKLQWHTYTVNDGLPNDNIFAARADADGNLWVSGTGGLSRFNRQQQTFTNYSAGDGLQCSEFYKNSVLQDADGTMWFGGTTGITWFNPRDIKTQIDSCQARIVSFMAGQNSLLPDASGIYTVGSDDHSFSIELATRPLLYTHRVSYRYSLDGDAWQTLPPLSNRLSFSRVASGSHTFSFQAIGDDISSEVTSITIYIEYPWYNTWWCRIIWCLLLLFIVWQSVLLVRRRRYELLLQQKRENEAAINEAKLQFFMNIAHEIRTPMTLVVAPLQKLINTDSDTQRQHSYRTIDRNANRVLQLVNDLMDLRKIDKAQMKLQCRKVTPGPIIEDLCESVSDLTAQHNVSLRHIDRLPSDLTAWIDQACFEKVILNLLSNAIKYTPGGGSIVVESAVTPDNQLRISVTDTGIGIPEADRKHIFERFYQVRHTAQSNMGTGIGLNLVHALVTLHHGQITLDSNPDGQGTCFCVTLPLSEQSYDASELYSGNTPEPQLRQSVTQSDIVHSTLRTDEVTDVTPATTSRQRRSLLIVEDDDEVRAYLVRELQPYYRITQCGNGREAYEALQREAVDLIISDVMMPEVDGIELCQRVRANVLLNHIPIIVLTAKSGDETRLQSLEIGANAFIPKPFNMEVLAKTVQNLISERDRLRTSFSGQQLPVSQVTTPDLQSPDERLLQRVIKIIDDNLSNPELTSEMIAQQVGLSRVHLYRKLKELTNQSARNYIRNIRLVKAAELLSRKKMAIAEVAYEVGFSNPNNFATAFKEMYGMSPTAYNELHCGENRTM